MMPLRAKLSRFFDDGVVLPQVDSNSAQGRSTQHFRANKGRSKRFWPSSAATHGGLLGWPPDDLTAKRGRCTALSEKAVCGFSILAAAIFKL